MADRPDTSAEVEAKVAAFLRRQAPDLKGSTVQELLGDSQREDIGPRMAKLHAVALTMLRHPMLLDRGVAVDVLASRKGQGGNTRAILNRARKLFEENSGWTVADALYAGGGMPASKAPKVDAERVRAAMRDRIIARNAQRVKRHESVEAERQGLAHGAGLVHEPLPAPQLEVVRYPSEQELKAELEKRINGAHAKLASHHESALFGAWSNFFAEALSSTKVVSSPIGRAEMEDVDKVNVFGHNGIAGFDFGMKLHAIWLRGARGSGKTLVLRKLAKEVETLHFTLDRDTLAYRPLVTPREGQKPRVVIMDDLHYAILAIHTNEHTAEAEEWLLDAVEQATRIAEENGAVLVLVSDGSPGDFASFFKHGKGRVGAFTDWQGHVVDRHITLRQEDVDKLWRELGSPPFRIHRSSDNHVLTERDLLAPIRRMRQFFNRHQGDSLAQVLDGRGTYWCDEKGNISIDLDGREFAEVGFIVSREYGLGMADSAWGDAMAEYFESGDHAHLYRAQLVEQTP